MDLATSTFGCMHLRSSNMRTRNVDRVLSRGGCVPRNVVCLETRTF